MRKSCAMMSSKVTPLIKEKGVDVDGAIEVGGITILDHLERSYTSLCLMVALYGTHDMEVVKNEKGDRKMA